MDDLNAAGQLTVQDMALVQHQFYNQQVQLGVLGQLALQFLTAGMTAGLTGIQAAMAQAAISGGVQGVVSGDFDIGAILTDVAFAGVSGVLTEAVNLDNILQMQAGQSLLGAVDGKFTFANIVDGLGDSVVKAGLTTAVYGGEFGDNFKSAFKSTVVNLAQADLQSLIGDRHTGENAQINGGEGSVGHVLEHFGVGCIAGAALGGSCAASGVAAGISAIYAGAVDPQQALRNKGQAIATAELFGGLGAAVVSGGDTNATMIASGVAGSAFQNNYLRHTDVALAVEKLKACAEGDTACREEILNFLAEQSVENDMNLIAQCGGDAKCMAETMVANRDYYDPMSFADTSDIRKALGDEYSDFADQIIGAKLHHVSPQISQAFETLPDFAENAAACADANDPICVYEGLARISIGVDAAQTIASLHPATALLSAISLCANGASPAACEAATIAMTEMAAERARLLKLAVKAAVEQAGPSDTVGNANVAGAGAANKGLPSGYTRNADGTINGPGNPGGQQALFRETGEVDASGRPILQRDSGGYFTIDAAGKQQRVAAADLPSTLQNRGDTPWQQSQTYIQGQVGGGEKSYLNGDEVPHGTPGSVRPDAVLGCGTQCFEVKNYDLSSTSGQNSLVNTTVTQINERAANLPAGMQQNIAIDITGQNVSTASQLDIKNRIVQGSNGAVDLDSIDFFVRP